MTSKYRESDLKASGSKNVSLQPGDLQVGGTYTASRLGEGRFRVGFGVDDITNPTHLQLTRPFGAGSDLHLYLTLRICLLSYRSRGTLMSYTDHSVQCRFKSNTPIIFS